MRKIMLVSLLTLVLLGSTACNLNFSFGNRDEEIVAEGQKEVLVATAGDIDQDSEDEAAANAVELEDKEQVLDDTRSEREKQLENREKGKTVAVFAVATMTVLVCLGVGVYALERGALKPIEHTVDTFTAPRIVVTKDNVPAAVAESPLGVLMGKSSVVVAELPGAQHATAQIGTAKAFAPALAAGIQRTERREQGAQVVNWMLNALRRPQQPVDAGTALATTDEE